MASSRTIFFFLHTPTPGITSPSLHTCTLRSLSSQHGTRTRPQLQPHKTRFSPSRPSLAFTFTTSARSLEQNYYEVLDIPPTATAAEIKKQFYALSLRHHPDRNRSDPDASQRFARISSAYNTLGNASRRATYDREHNINPQPHRQPAGSHSSHSANLHKGYAGSRAPSGLSRRRGTYRGPPPSFYQQGGYGNTGRTEAGSWKAGAEYANEAANGAGVNKKRDPEDWRGFIERNPVGHFNARGHFRTQRAEDVRRRDRYVRARQARFKEDGEDGEKGEVRVLRFAAVSGVLVFTVLLGGFAQWVMPSGHRGDGDKAERMARRRREVMSG